jgi:thiol reductant ABC exporter CydC subunit
MPPVITLWIAIAGVRFFGIARPVFRYAGRLISHDAAFRVVAEFRTKVYERLIPLTPSRLGRHHRGQILAGLVSDVDAVQEFDLRVLEPGAVAALVSAGCVALGVAILPSAGAVLAAGFVVAGIAAPLMAAAALRRATVSLAPVRAAMSAAVVDVLRGAPDLIAMGATDQKLEEIDRLDAELTRMARRAAWATGVGTGVAMLAAGASVWGSAVVAPPAVHDGRLAGVMVAVVVLLPLAAFEALVPLPQAAVLVSRVRSAARRLFGLLDETPAVTEPTVPLALPGGLYTIELRQASARWTECGPRVLDDLDLTLRPGEHIAVTGMSGAGKSTLAALLLRFLDPEDRGTVLLNGIDVFDLAVDDVRRVVGCVAGDAHIFASDLRENLRLAKPEAPDEELVHTLYRVRLGEWYAALPVGLATPLGEGGALISGGERRRIALARALLADQPILILDEPTEGLDRPTAMALVADLLDTASDRAVLMLTHRDEGLDLVDRRYCLVDGRLIASGDGTPLPGYPGLAAPSGLAEVIQPG